MNENETPPAADAGTELPIFPTHAPDVFRKPAETAELFAQVFEQLAVVVDVDDSTLASPTPCTGFTVARLQTHTLGWLQFFAAALTDPAAVDQRPDPEAFVLDTATPGSEIVRSSASLIDSAIHDDVFAALVTMSSSKMTGDGVLAMALGEYMIHGWDLAVATGQRYSAPAVAVGPAHDFLKGTVTPEYRGPDSGFFDAEVTVPADASEFEKLLGFAGRDPNWTMHPSS